MQFDNASGAESGTSRRFWLAIRVVTAGLWVVVLWFLFVVARSDPSVASIVSVAAFTGLFVVIHAQMLLRYWARRHNHVLNAKLLGTGYTSELDELPNRNYLLSELRREIRRARQENSPFTLVIVSLESDEIRNAEDAAFVERATHQLLAAVRRNFRGSDLFVHLGETHFGVLLVDCNVRGALSYLRRFPGQVLVSDGRDMADLPVTIRVAQYDMEAFYATDVLSEAENTTPLKHKPKKRAQSSAA